MAHCPECDAELSEESDVEFVDMGSETPMFKADKRFYLVACSRCGVTIGTGVAGGAV